MAASKIEAYLVAERLNTASAGCFFGQICGKGKPLVLRTELRDVLKMDVDGKLAVLYPFGVVALVGFSNAEVRTLLHFLTSIGETVDEQLFAHYADSYNLDAGGIDGDVNPGEGLDSFRQVLCACDALAQSLLIQRLDDRVGRLSDRSGDLVVIAGKGRLFYIQSHFDALVEVLRFQFDYCASYNERSWKALPGGCASRRSRERLEDHHELRERRRALARKSENLGSAISTLAEHSFRRQELKVYSVQAFLILSFIVLDIFYYLL